MTDTVSTAEAAAILGCSDALIRKRIAAKRLAAEKVAGAWRIQRTALAEVEVLANGARNGAENGSQGSVAELRARLDASDVLITELRARVEEQATMLAMYAELHARPVVQALPARRSWLGRLLGARGESA